MGTLPVLLKNPNILLIGGGKVALHKAQILLNNNINFFIIAPQLCNKLLSLNIPWSQKKLEPKDLDQAQIVIDATGDPDVAALILKKKEHKNLLVNCVDQPDLCDFYFSSLLNYGNLKIAVSTNGHSPTIGQVIRDEIATIIPAKIEHLVEEKNHERKLGIINPLATKEQCKKLLFTAARYIKRDIP
ncbi:MAG: hypothetical protein B6I36_02915 [Desulfobacteraceae bacterium 4572_35.1]|nr:MAG: hypothetical protein B6I36_02915 [Desulfobacteraceae bacterium 4572_35.1]